MKGEPTKGKTLCFKEYHQEREKKQPMEWEKTFINNISDKGLTSRSDTEFLQQTNNLLKMDKESEQTVLQRQTNGQQAHGKDTQHHQSLGTCKSKPRRQDFTVTRMAIIKTTVGQDVVKPEPSYSAGGKAKGWKTVSQFLKWTHNSPPGVTT